MHRGGTGKDREERESQNVRIGVVSTTKVSHR